MVTATSALGQSGKSATKDSTLEYASTTSGSPRTESSESNANEKRKKSSRHKQRRVRQCYSCQLPCLRTDRSLIRALGQVYHYDCFTCKDCHVLVADKFYALNTSRDASNFKIVCEEHYRAQVDGGGTALCQRCQQPMKAANTINNNNENANKTNPQLCQQCQNTNKCSECSQYSLNSEDICYEFEDRVYCLLHFSDIPEIQCSGCNQAILEKFVEHKHFPGKKWHPECYMIFKFWHVRLADTLHINDGSMKLTTLQLKLHQSTMERKANRIWVDLSSFEESSAACISDMLLLVAAGAYMEGFRMASQFVMHLAVLYNALDDIQQKSTRNGKVLPCSKESKTVCDQVIRFFYLLAQSDDKKMDNNRGATQELLSLVTSLAQNFKTLIRIGLTGALHLERDCPSSNAIPEFLNNLLELERKRVWVGGRYWFKEDPFLSVLGSSANHDKASLYTKQHQDILWDQCHSCQQLIDEDCYQYENRFRWHPSCFVCSQCRHVFTNLITVQFSANSASGSHVLLCSQCSTSPVTGQQNYHGTVYPLFTYMTQLQHYLYILKLVLARLYHVMNSSETHSDRQLDIYDQQNSSNKTIMSYNSTTLPSSATIPFTISNHSNHQPTLQQEQKPLRRRSIIGSINFGNIKRVKGADLDRINDSTNNGNTSSIKISANEPKNTYHHRSLILEKSSSTSTQQRQTRHSTILSPSTPQPSSTTSETGKHGLVSVTRRLSANTRQRFGSLRNPVNQKQSTKSPQLQHKQQCTYDEDLRGTVAPSTPPISKISVNKPSVSARSANSVNLYEHLLQLSPNQYLLVSYIAAKSINSILPDMYSLNEWMQFVDLQKPTLWNKLKTRIRTPQSPSTDRHHSPKVFGAPLSLLSSTTYYHDQQPKNEAVDLKMYIWTNNLYGIKHGEERNHAVIQEINTCFKSIHCKVPIFIQHCLLVLLQRDLSVEGIFRKNGNIRELRRLENVIDNDTSGDSTAMFELLTKQTSIQLAALLMRYLRELPEPLLTYRLYPVFVAAAGLENEEKIKSALHLACCMLPKENRDTMQVIFHFLHHVSTFKSSNKMDICNLASIMAPSFLHNRTTSYQHQETATSISNSRSIITDRIPNKEIDIVKKLIKYHDQLGKTPDDMLSSVSDHEMVEWLTSIDSKHFLKYYDGTTRQGTTRPASTSLSPTTHRPNHFSAVALYDEPYSSINTSISATTPSNNFMNKRPTSLGIKEHHLSTSNHYQLPM
ncbi:hypothetical protein BCR42DRAFT_487805 [Absidia repens]|uniref:RhoGAP-domain-containing protein n=1 Tax=Absidia repens TaxID=90262 RepID=A0A1X2ITW4_9FUNG|nr:hypothetical protein BCR42DRAFT_487805 [Absidia repens]